MPASPPTEQEREALDLFDRAERRAPATSSLRRDALVHAIKLSHSPHASLKYLAAANIAKFFKAFPDFEEDAINAIYDLCEDQDQNIRIQGYKAVVQMSKEQPGWVERNVDVLVQLLQSDEPGEVAVVKTALIQHLELDSKVTLGVLCDQIVPPDDPMEDEDRAIRERLRRLVIAFLAEEAREPLLAQLRSLGDGGKDQEQALIDTLLKVTSKFGDADAAKITRGILVFLPPFKTGRPTRRGDQLLQTLLAQAASALKEDLAPGGRSPAGLERSRVYLELSDFMCRERGAADPVRLLRFYCTSSLMGKMTLGRLSDDARLFFIVHLAHALVACGQQPGPESGELASMRRQVVDALTIVLPFFVQTAPSDAQAWRSCETLLRTCQQRKEQQTKWNLPSPLLSVLVEIAHLADEKQTPESKRVGDLSRSLTSPPSDPILPPARPPPLAAPPSLPVINVPGDVALGKRRAVDESDVPGELQGSQKLSIKGQHERQRRRRKDPSPQQSLGSGASTPVSATEDSSVASGMTWLKTTTDGEAPSLLLRMGRKRPPPLASGGKASKSKSPPALPSQRSASPRRSSTGLPNVSLGISIKGAARSHSHSHSLLERIQGDGS
ncbi:apoptosis inhibitory protein 5-domain-containing protein [Russula earlei]|uniref:Apoptosis inhibitory protein 5-domain-containing protein n=1 Tax=Russula earlei TaxID=71964 RepID=A0ACC0TTI1_9AGAM|nr:apoptosis inhibitory protein 5-domain-containing protein [Russula earlei]